MAVYINGKKVKPFDTVSGTIIEDSPTILSPRGGGMGEGGGVEPIGENLRLPQDDVSKIGQIALKNPTV